MPPSKRFGVLAAVCCLVLAPAAADAGKPVTKDGVTQQLKTKVTPDKAGSKGVSVHVRVSDLYSSATQREHTFTKDVRLTLPPGMKINPANAGVCKLSAIDKANNVSPCSKSSIVGTGTTVVDARPAVKSFLRGTVTLYNVQGRHHSILFWISVQVAGKTVTAANLYVIQQKGTTEDASFTDSPPAKGTTTSLYGVRVADFTLRNSSTGKPYITAPPTCTGSWPFVLLISSYDGGVTQTSTDKAACKH